MYKPDGQDIASRDTAPVAPRLRKLNNPCNDVTTIAARPIIIFASSEESVGDIRLRQSAKRVIQRDFRDVEGAEAVGFSHSQFGLVVETLDYAAGELLPGALVVQDQRGCERSVLAIFFIGSMRERMTWQHPHDSPHFSDRPENVCEERLLVQHTGETLHQRTQPAFRHHGDQVVEPAGFEVADCAAACA
jgi:hypothetical protein